MMQNKSKDTKRMKMIGIMTICLIAMIAVTLFSTVYFKHQLNQAEKLEENAYKQYGRHYVLITDNIEDTFWKSVYDGAKEEGEKSNSYIERLGIDLPVEYSKGELMQIAIASKVDGIILEADDTMWTRNLIAEAVTEGIPVVTVLSDGYGTLRQSFVGINGYNLGQEYGRQVIDIAESDTELVYILVNSKTNNMEKNIIFAGIKETIEKEAPDLKGIKIEMTVVRNESTFSAEESIRDIFLKGKELPDIVICLNEPNTLSAYQAVVDYNKVGEIDIIGYYASSKILDAIAGNIISSTIAIDSTQMGTKSVEALNEFIQTGYVSDYMPADTSVITAENVEGYRKNVLQTEER